MFRGENRRIAWKDYKPVNFRIGLRDTLFGSGRERKGGFCGRVMGQRITKWVCIVPPVILSRAFVTPNANYMSTVHAPYHGRPSVRDGTMRVARANGPLPHQRRCTNFSDVLIKITRCLHLRKLRRFCHVWQENPGKSVFFNSNKKCVTRRRAPPFHSIFGKVDHTREIQFFYRHS